MMRSKDADGWMDGEGFLFARSLLADCVEWSASFIAIAACHV